MSNSTSAMSGWDQDGFLSMMIMLVIHVNSEIIHPNLSKFVLGQHVFHGGLNDVFGPFAHNVLNGHFFEPAGIAAVVDVEFVDGFASG